MESQKSPENDLSDLIEDDDLDCFFVANQDKFELDMDLLTRYANLGGSLSYDNPEAFDFYFKVDL